MIVLKLRLLGPFEARDAADRLIDVSAKKSQGLLAVLALSPCGWVARERLAYLMWSERGDAQARSSLRQSLASLRKEFSTIETSPLSADEDRIALDLVRVEVDAVSLQRHARLDDLRTLREAVGLYQGEFLADTTIRDPAFEEWVAAERARLHEIAVATAEKLWTREKRGQRMDIARRLVALDPLREFSHGALMQSYAEVGETGLALQQYATCRDILKAEFGIAPSRDIETLRQRILDEEPVASSFAGRAAVSESGARARDKPSIAVLPFANLSEDPEQDYFADGVVEEMITALSRFHGLFVIARNSSFAYKGRVADVERIGQELGVRYVLQGTVRKAAGRVRIAAKLIDALSGVHLWAERFDGALENIFDLQDQVTARVVGAVAPKLEQAEIERIRRKPTESMDAYDHFLRGIAGLHRWTREGNDQALSHFYRAIELDSNYAAAHGLDARTYVQRSAGGWIKGHLRDFGEATRLARRAIELDRDDAVALCSAGFALARICDEVSDGDASIDRAIELNPNLAPAWLYSGWVKASMGKPDLALERLAQAQRLSPNDPQAYSVQTGTAFAHFVAGRYPEASSCAETATRNRPDFLLVWVMDAVCAALAGRMGEAQKAVARLLQIDPALRISDLPAVQYMQPGDRLRWMDGLRRSGLPE